MAWSSSEDVNGGMLQRSHVGHTKLNLEQLPHCCVTTGKSKHSGMPTSVGQGHIIVFFRRSP